MWVTKARIWPAKLESTLRWVSWLGGLIVTLIYLHFRRVSLTNKLRYQLLNLIVVVHVLTDLLCLALISRGIEGVTSQLYVNVIIKHSFFERHIRPQISISQLQQLVILLQYALIFLKQLVVHELVVFRGVVNRYIEPTNIHIFRLCFLCTFLELLAKFFRVYGVSWSCRWTSSGRATLHHFTMLLLAVKLSFLFLQSMFCLTLIGILKVILARCVVGSHRWILEHDAEVLGKVGILYDVQTLILIELTALVLSEHSCVI